MSFYMKNLALEGQFYDPIQNSLQPFKDLVSALNATGHDTTDLDNAINDTTEQITKLRKVAKKSRNAILSEGFKGKTGEYLKECEQDSLT